MNSETILTPYNSAKLAQQVYGILNFNNINEIEGWLSTRDPNHSINLLKGRTGGPGIIKSRTAFGFISKGTERQSPGHCFITLRGTKKLGDWLSNFNLGTGTSAYKKSVHDGFKTAFDSIRADLDPLIQNLPGERIHTVHCIGHSLGGALATLCAEYISQRFSYKPYLYTFGAPRVGKQDFSDKYIIEVGEERVFRVYHRTDIVPCIPTWPFVHMPNVLSNIKYSRHDYFLPSPGVAAWSTWHGMDKYVKSVKNANWATLASGEHKVDSQHVAKRWLTAKQPVHVTPENIRFFEVSLNWLIANQLYDASSSLVTVANTGFTALDKVSEMIAKGVQLQNDLGGWMRRLVRRMMQMLGVEGMYDTVIQPVNIIRLFFGRLQSIVHAAAQKAIDAVLVGNKAI